MHQNPYFSIGVILKFFATLIVPNVYSKLLLLGEKMSLILSLYDVLIFHAIYLKQIVTF